MEDRETRVLYLEMTNRSPAAYAEHRVPVVLAEPAVERATWWANERPDRTDLPRTLDEFTTLGVYEAAATFTAPLTPEDVRGLQFVRTVRPGQGCVTGRPTVGLELVLISPKTPEGAQALRDWADFVHIRHIAAAGIDGFAMITPYQNVEGATPRWLHFYEIDDPAAEATFQRMTPMTAERLGGTDTDAFRQWAWHPELCIDYVNTFTLAGESAAR